MTRDRGRDDGGWLQDIQQLERDASNPTQPTPVRPVDRHDGDDDSEDGIDRRSAQPEPVESSTSPLLEAIQRAGSFETLRLVGTPTDSRYGRSVDVRVTAEGETHDLELRLFRREEALEPALLDQLDRWAAVGDCDGIVPVVEGADDPRPWCCTPRLGGTLADRSPGSLSDALGQARLLTRTVRGLHERGLLQAGLDPAHVVYPPDSERPHLDSVGLFDVYRRSDGAGRALDPRYAPPEYFDDRYGVVDRTTDVYGLGAVLYRLFTGKAPYDCSLDAVREAVLTDPFPRPSAVADVPQAVDDLVTRATATDKFDRYESVQRLHEDVRELSRWFEQ